MIGHGGGLRSLNIFLKMGVSHGFLVLGRDCSPYGPHRSPASRPFDSVVLRAERGASLHLDRFCICGDSRAPPHFRAKRVTREGQDKY